MLYQPSTQWIPLNVAQDGKQMVVLLNGESLKTPLPNMTATSVVLMIATDVRRQEPLHPLPEISVQVRPYHQMIWQNTVAEYPHSNALTRSIEQVNKWFVISVFPKDLLAGIAAIDNVVAHSTTDARAVLGMPGSATAKTI